MMSGGVDSSVAAGLLLEQGHDVTGVTLRLADAPADSGRVGGCCSLQDVEDARCVAHFLGIPHYSLNEKDLFSRTVLANFSREYHRGRTPNPCYRCNQWVKFDYVFHWAETLGFEKVATGHYANLTERQGSLFLERGADRNKDQTYFLASVRKSVLPHLAFPLGHLTKPEVRQIAERMGLTTADKGESQELCFAHDLDYRKALEQGTPGEIVDCEGEVVGQHLGIEGYTLGQRKGIRLSGGPFYVVHMDSNSNRVVIGPEESLYSDTVIVGELNLYRELREGEILTAFPRYRHPGSPAMVERVDQDVLQLRFLSPERALTPGQVLALYENDLLIAGSIIEEVSVSEDLQGMRDCGARGGT